MTLLYLATAVLLVASALADSGRTRRALKVAGKRFMKVLPAFLIMLVFLAVALRVTPERVMSALLGGGGKLQAMAVAGAFGSISIMPGFIAFPLCGILLERGACYMVLSAFSTTVMMVGVVTFPLEKAYLGTRLAVVRNVLSLIVALAVAIATGFAFGELP